MHLGAGDVVRLTGTANESQGLYRIDRLEQAEMQLADAVRVEPAVYSPSDVKDEAVATKPYIAPVPVLPVFLDLPLMTGSEVPYAPYLAVTADPWPGSVAVFSASQDDGYALSDVIAGQAVVGFTETPLRRASAGLWDTGAPLRVNLIDGVLESQSGAALLNGANLAAIGDGTPGNWEVFQFGDATLQEPGVYALGNRLRGQLGTDAIMPDVWPEGSMFVLLDGRVYQTGLLRSERGVAKHYRIGPANRGYDDLSYVHLVEAFDGNGLRPYTPVHLQVNSSSAGDDFTWMRRTRIDGDDWDGLDVPLGEETESYLVRVLSGGSVLREVVIGSASWRYSAAMKAADGLSESYEFAVAQVSATYGPGPFARLGAG